MAKEMDINSAILRLYFSIAVSDSDLHDNEAGMIADQATLIARRIRAASLPTREDVERILGSYLIDYARYGGKDDETYPVDILREAIDYIDEDEMRSTVLTQMMAIALADGSVHNNEMFLLKHVAREWDMEEEFSDRLINKLFKPAPKL